MQVDLPVTEKSIDMNRGISTSVVDSKDENDNFSYLPSIHGVYRSKLQSGASADLRAQKSRRNIGGATGKSPGNLMMASYRTRGSKGPFDVNQSMPDYSERIKYYDKLRAKELIQERSQEDLLNSNQSSLINLSAARSVKKLRKGMYNFSQEGS